MHGTLPSRVPPAGPRTLGFGFRFAEVDILRWQLAVCLSGLIERNRDEKTTRNEVDLLHGLLFFVSSSFSWPRSGVGVSGFEKG